MRLPITLCLAWGLGSFPLSVMGNIFNFLVSRFATDFLGIATGTAATLLAASQLWDAFLDPFVGSVSDRIRSRSGRRRPVMLIATISAPAATLGFFCARYRRLAAPRLLRRRAGFFSSAYALNGVCRDFVVTGASRSTDIIAWVG